MADRPRLWLAPVHARRIGLSVTDQAVSSAGNLAVTIIAARNLGVDQFGAFSVVYTVSVLALGTCRALTSEPLMIRFSGGDEAEARDQGAHAVGATLLIGLGLGALTALVALAFSGALRTGLLVLAVGLPGLLVQDAWRFVCFTIARPVIALVNDVVWVAIVVGTSAVIQLAGTPSLVSVTVTWVAASTVCAVLGAVQLRAFPNPAHALRWMRSQWDLGVRFLVDFVTASGVVYLSLLALGAIVGLSATAAIRGVQTFFGPVNVAFAGLTVALIPEGVRLAQRNRPRLRTFVLVLTVGLTGLAAVWLVIGLVLPESIGVAVLGDTWSDARTVLPVIGIGLVAGGITGGAFVGLRSLGDARGNLRVRLVSAPILLVAPLVGAVVGDTDGFAVGFAAASVVAAILWWFQYQRSVEGSVEGVAGA